MEYGDRFHVVRVAQVEEHASVGDDVGGQHVGDLLGPVGPGDLGLLHPGVESGGVCALAELDALLEVDGLFVPPQLIGLGLSGGVVLGGLRQVSSTVVLQYLLHREEVDTLHGGQHVDEDVHLQLGAAQRHVLSHIVGVVDITTGQSEREGDLGEVLNGEQGSAQLRSQGVVLHQVYGGCEVEGGHAARLRVLCQHDLGQLPVVRQQRGRVGDLIGLGCPVLIHVREGEQAVVNHPEQGGPAVVVGHVERQVGPVPVDADHHQAGAQQDEVQVLHGLGVLGTHRELGWAEHLPAVCSRIVTGRHGVL